MIIIQLLLLIIMPPQGRKKIIFNASLLDAMLQLVLTGPGHMETPDPRQAGTCHLGIHQPAVSKDTIVIGLARLEL